ncbi:MAG TPA: PEP-utilizing enzyme [Candidatus Paceibacterota bacterium]
MSNEIVLKGMGTSAGTAEGAVCVINSRADFNKFKEGNVLVTKITDPTMVMIMNEASAIVCDIGGITSHPSIISRELGIPCVVNTKEATSKLQDGQKIIVNGTTGEIFVA